jgi:hypothetical protein
LRRSLWILLLCLVLGLGPSGIAPGAAAAQDRLEELKYRLSLGIWEDVARVHLRLTRMGPDRYKAEFAGAAQGAWRVLSRWLPESYETEMIMEAGRLKPLVYREKFQAKGQKVSKEYRFNYSLGVLEIWRGVDHRKPEKRWQIPLKEPVYDILTLFYNLRLGAFGPLRGGQTLKVALIPIPEPREMTINLGPETAQGRKVMLTVKTKGVPGGDGPYFLFCTPENVPRLAWVRVLTFARLSGELRNPGEIIKDLLPPAPRDSLPDGEKR